MIEKSDTAMRLVACQLVLTRFAGRAELERMAARDPVSLARLEARLGLATEADVLMAQREHATRVLWSQLSYRRENLGYLLAGDDYAARERAAARRYAGGYEGPIESPIETLVAPDACARIDLVRAKRRALAQIVDPIAARQPGHAQGVIARRRAKELVEAAGFRTATHSHVTYYLSVDRGHEGADSETGSARPQSVGLCNAYSRQGFSVTTSEHTWCVSAAILTPEVRALNAAARRGIVYLSLTTRVRQGRGTSLVVEQPTARGAWRQP